MDLADVSPDPFVFYASTTRVEITCHHPEVMTALRRIWGACGVAYLPSRRVMRVTVAEEHPHLVSIDGEEVASPFRVCDLHPLVEELLYERFLPVEEDLVRLHAACVSRGERVLLFCGESGAGKSTLSLHAVRRGYRYFCDDIAYSDGLQMWGVPRAIQFDLQSLKSLAPHLEGADVTSYPVTGWDGGRFAVPLFPIPAEGVARAAAPADDVVLVLPRRDRRTEVTRAPALEGLGVLHAAALGGRGVDLEPLSRQCFRLSWTDGPSALDALEETLESSVART